MFPALAHVGAARALADGVQIERAHNAFQVLVALAAEKFDAQPIRPRMRAQRHRHRRRIRDDVEWSRHLESHETPILHPCPSPLKRGTLASNSTGKQSRATESKSTDPARLFSPCVRELL